MFMPGAKWSGVTQFANRTDSYAQKMDSHASEVWKDIMKDQKKREEEESRPRGSTGSNNGNNNRGKNWASNSDKSDKECFYCHRKGHFENKCRKKARDEEKEKEKKK